MDWNSSGIKTQEPRDHKKRGEAGRSPLALVKLPDKAGSFQLLHQAHIHEALWICGGGFRSARRHIIQQCLYTLGIRIGNLGERRVVGPIGPL
jgi:hypothetical protein